MNKKIKPLITLGLSCMCLSVLGCSPSRLEAEQEPGTVLHYVDFFNNYMREEFELSNGTKGKGNNLIYKTVEVRGEHAIAKPEEDPVRKNYEFQGWYKEEACENEWNFKTDVVMGNTRLFAKWGVAQKEQGQEPEYTPPSTVRPDEAGMDYAIKSVMYSQVNNGQVKLSTAAIMKLEANKDNVLPFMEYNVKKDIPFTATYANNNITVNVGTQTINIQVKDDSLNLVLDNATYENKAKKYEANALEEDSYHVMLAGSSSIEFWENSKQDLEPVVSFNHGIGGTTIEQWDNSLNQRLVYPYKPKMVVYYVGINNVINSKQSAATIWSNLQTFLNHTHENLPDTKVQYIMMNLIPGYRTYWDIINEVNAKLVEYQKTNTWLTLINPGEALLKGNGEPNAAYFRTDGLHLSHYGYVVWGEIIKQSIFKGLENK